jgi:hypothetical protein
MSKNILLNAKKNRLEKEVLRQEQIWPGQIYEYSEIDENLEKIIRKIVQQELHKAKK